MPKLKAAPQKQGEIHEFNGTTYDEDGEVMLGFYYRFLNEFDAPLTLLMGPYASALEAEAACQIEFNLSM